MFNHLVTAAKGLFTRHPEEEPSNSVDSSAHPKMVTATRRGDITPDKAVSGKRKSRPTSAGKPDGQETKRKRSNPMTTDTSANAANGTPEETSNMNGPNAPAGKKIRFGSEESEAIETQPEEITETPKENSDDEDSDDDAPETFDNSAQLSKMKEQAKKHEAAKQLYV